MSDGESIRHSSYTSSPSSDLASGETNQETNADDEGVHVSFDLSNPADMELKLENLTDKEMDELLKQAYKVNKDLKKELHRQERAQSGKSQTSKSKSKSKDSSDSRGNSSLPPLRTTSGSRGFTSLNHRSSAQTKAASPVSPSRQKAKTAVQQPSFKPRPEWNDRFNF